MRKLPWLLAWMCGGAAWATPGANGEVVVLEGFHDPVAGELTLLGENFDVGQPFVVTFGASNVPLQNCIVIDSQMAVCDFNGGLAPGGYAMTIVNGPAANDWTTFFYSRGAGGARGPAGPAGPPGPAGGPAGPAGPQGATGPAGPQGATGPEGPAGPQGAAGPAGPAGPQGATGPEGPAGPQGPTGPQGPAGLQGAPGDTGPQGPPGQTGAQGPQGPAGPTGLQGATGNTGSQGPAGPQGPSGVAVATAPLAYNSGTQTISLNPGTATGQVLTWNGSSWVAQAPAAGGGTRSNMQPYLALTYQIALQGIFPSRNAADPFLAEIMIFAGNFDVRGWAFCNGQVLSIAQNTALFSLLGTNFGGNGQTTFGLPDLRGRVPVHFGQGPGLTYRNIGEAGGSETVVY